MSDKEVRIITKKEATYFIINIHYLHRFPSMSFIFGLFKNDELIGVCTCYLLSTKIFKLFKISR